MKIVIVDPSSYVKPYDGNSIDTEGMGASWTWIIYLAREFVKLGHRVIVLNHCNNPGNYAGVTYLTRKIPDDLNNEEIKKQLKGTDALIVNRGSCLDWEDCLERYCGITGYKKYVVCTDSGGAQHGQPEKFAKYDKVISISNWLNQINIIANSSISSDYFHCIPLGVDTDMFKPAEKAVRTNICFVGAVVSARRPQYVFDAFIAARKLRPDIKLKLHFIGSAAIWGGPPEGTSEQMQMVMQNAYTKAAEYSADIKLYGDIPHAELAKTLPQMGMMIYPTITETCGVSILEAQASGVPVIVPSDSMFSAVSERIYHTETGVVRDFGKMHEVGMAIIDMVENDHVYNKTRNQAREKVVRENDWSVIARRWQKEVFEAKNVIEIEKDKQEIKNMTIGVGVLSFQNRSLLEKCITSLKLNAKMPMKIVVWDNNSKGYGCDNAEYIKTNHPDITLIESDANKHCVVPRNNIVEYFRKNHPEIKYMLFSDMDVMFKPNFLYPMVEIMQNNDDCAIVAYPIANCGFRPDDKGRVSEVMSICNLHRLESFDIFPNPNRPFDENFKVYSFDSWICQTLNLNNWHTYLVMGKVGYDHIGGQINQFLSDAEKIKHADVVYWQSIADKLSFKKRWEDKNSADYVCIGNTLKNEGKLDDAEREYKDGISRYPDNGTLFYCLGNLEKDRENWRSAIEYYQNALKFEPKNFKIIYAVEECRRKID